MNEALTNYEKAYKKLEECYLTDKEEEAKEEYFEASVNLVEWAYKKSFTPEQKELLRNYMYSSMS